MPTEEPACLAAPRAETSPPPVQALGPHVAVLGVKFYSVPLVGGAAGGGAPLPQPSLFPAAYRTSDSVLIAEHGSWNREQAIGYRVALVQVGWCRADRLAVGGRAGL